MTDSILNLYRCLALHPAIAGLINSGLPVRILIGTDQYHRILGDELHDRCPPGQYSMVQHLYLDKDTAHELRAAIVACDIYVFLYAESTLYSPRPEGLPSLALLGKTMIETRRKAVLFRDYGTHLFEAFSENIDSIARRNRMLLQHAAKASSICYRDGRGGGISAVLNVDQQWTSIDGTGNEDIVPGEISTKLNTLEGQVSFSGTFLGTAPFARIYGVAQCLMILTLAHGRLIRFESNHQQFSRDFNHYLESHPGNRIVESFGIGTNTGVAGLYGRNAKFEQRHPGLHLGLGGGAKESHPLKLLFLGGEIYFDDCIVYESAFSV